MVLVSFVSLVVQNGEIKEAPMKRSTRLASLVGLSLLESLSAIGANVVAAVWQPARARNYTPIASATLPHDSSVWPSSLRR